MFKGKVAEMVESIEEYDNASWWEQDLASIGMGFTKLFEGVGTLGENIIDGVAMVAGFTTGWMSEEWKNDVSNFIKKDHVGDFFAEQYENGILSEMNDLSNFSHTSDAANICKAAGTVAGYVVLDTFTGGVASITFNALAGAGRKTQEQLQSGKDFYSASLSGFVEGGKDALITYGFQKLNQATKGVNKAEEAFNKSGAANFADDVVKAADKVDDVVKGAANSADDVVKAADEAEVVATEILDKNQKVIANSKAEIGGSLGNTSKIPFSNKIKAKASNTVNKIGQTKVGQKVIQTGKWAKNTKIGTGVTKAGKFIGEQAVKHPNITKGVGIAYGINTQTKAYKASEQFRKNNQHNTNLNGINNANSNLVEDNIHIFNENNANYTPKYNNNYNSPSSPTVPESTPKSTNGGRSSGGGSSYRATTGGTTSSSTPTATSPTSNTNTGDSTQQFKKEKIKAEVTEKKPVETRTNIDVTPNPNPTPTPNPEPNPTPTPKPEPDKVITPPSDNTNNTTTTVTPPPTNTNTGGQNNQYTGGGYSGSGGYQGYTGENTDIDFTTEGADDFSDIDDMLTDSTTSIDDVIKGSKYTKIPTSSKPITSASSGGGGSAVIPVVAGLSAAAAAGVGAKVYMDRKNNNSNGEDEIETEEWSGEDTLNLDYDDSSDTESYLDEDDDYGYQTEEQTERYDARNNEELADLQ